MSIELDKGLKGLLDGLAGVFPILPQPPTFPVIRYQRVYVTRQTSIDAVNVGVTEVGMQVDCMATTHDAARTLADSVFGILNGYTGAWGTLTARLVLLQTENDLYDQDGDKITHWVSQRYQIWTNME